MVRRTAFRPLFVCRIGYWGKRVETVPFGGEPVSCGRPSSFCGSNPLSLFSSCLVAWPDKLTCLLFEGRDASDRVCGIGHRSCIRTFGPRSRRIILFHFCWINPDSWIHFGALLPVPTTIESALPPGPHCGSSFATGSLSSHDTLIEQSFYSAH